MNWNISRTNDQSTNMYYMSSQWDSLKEVSYYSYDDCKGMLVMNKVGQWISDKKSKCIPPCTLWFIESEKKMENYSFEEGGRPWKNLKYCPCFPMI